MSDEKKIPEGDASDPLTLTNLILNHDARKVGFDWVHYGPGRSKSAEELLVTEPVQVAYITPGEFIKDKPVTEGVPTGSSVATPLDTPGIGVEANNLDPTVRSSDPKFNMCPAYCEEICRVTGKPCVYSNIDYKECGIYYLAGSGDPSLFEVPPGREQSAEYEKGIKS